MGVFLVIFVIFLILMLLQIVWMATMIYKLRDSGKQLDDATGRLREELARRWSSDEFAQLLNGPVVPILPEIPIPDLSPEAWMAEARWLMPRHGSLTGKLRTRPAKNDA